jgi:hypothetical protein
MRWISVCSLPGPPIVWSIVGSSQSGPVLSRPLRFRARRLRRRLVQLAMHFTQYSSIFCVSKKSLLEMERVKRSDSDF